MFNRFIASVWIPLKQNLTRAFALLENKHRGVSSLRRGVRVRRQSIRTGTTIPDEDELKRRNVRRGRSHLRLCLLALGRRVLTF